MLERSVIEHDYELYLTITDLLVKISKMIMSAYKIIMADPTLFFH